MKTVTCLTVFAALSLMAVARPSALAISGLPSDLGTRSLSSMDLFGIEKRDASNANGPANTQSTCKVKPANIVKVINDADQGHFEKSYFTKASVLVPTWTPDFNDMYLDSVDFVGTPCSIAYCNKEEKPKNGKRNTVHVTNPKGTECVMPKGTVSQFKCRNGKGGVTLTVDHTGKSSFVATNVIAFFGTWIAPKATCVHATATGTSAYQADVLFVACNNDGKGGDQCHL